jgi:hypothetical protein
MKRVLIHAQRTMKMAMLLSDPDSWGMSLLYVKLSLTRVLHRFNRILVILEREKKQSSDWFTLTTLSKMAAIHLQPPFLTLI